MQTNGAVYTLTVLVGTLSVRFFTSCNLHNSAWIACYRWTLVLVYWTLVVLSCPINKLTFVRPWPDWRFFKAARLGSGDCP